MCDAEPEGEAAAVCDADSCHPFSAADFAQCALHGEAGGGGGGVIGARCTLDSNRHLVPSAMCRVFGNEDGGAWRLLNKATLEAVPNYDKPGQVDRRDFFC